MANRGNFETNEYKSLLDAWNARVRVEWGIVSKNPYTSTAQLEVRFIFTTADFVDEGNSPSYFIGPMDFTIDGQSEHFDFKELFWTSVGYGGRNYPEIRKKTYTINYNNAISKTITMSLSTKCDRGSVYEEKTLTGSGTFTLDSIDYSSDFSELTDGTLGVLQNISLDKKQNFVQDTLTYSCGTVTDTIADKSSLAEFSVALPLTLKEQGVIGRSMAVTYTLTSYVNNVQVGAVKTKTVQVLVPDLASTLSIESFVLGSTSILTVNRAQSYLRETISYSCGTVTDVVISEKNEETEIDFPVPLSLALQNTTGTSVNITFKIQTFISDEEDAFLYDTKTLTKSFSIPASVAPTITIHTLTEANAEISEHFTAFVNHKSRITWRISAIGAYGSTLVSSRITIAGSTKNTARGTTDTINFDEGGVKQAIMTVTDTRNRSTSITVDYTVYDYSEPLIFSLNANRTTDGIAVDDIGTILMLAANYRAAPINNENTVSVEVGYRFAGTTGEFIPLVSSIPDDTYEYNASEAFNKSGDPSFSAGNSYEIRFVLTDFFSSVSETTFMTMGGFAGGTTFYFVNSRYEVLPLSSNNYFHLIDIDGLTTANADLSSLSLGNADGDIVNNAKAQPRTLILTLKIKEGVNVKEAKSSILQKVKLKQAASIEWFEASKHVIINGTVESIDMPRFENGIAMQITLHCSNPYWEDYNDTVTAENTITNEGDVETGLIFTLTATGVVTNPTITTDNGEVFGIGYGTGAKQITLSSGDVLTVDTRQGKKSVKLNTSTNLIAFVKPQSVWHQLMTGENEFIFDDNITPSITYKQKYI